MSDFEQKLQSLEEKMKRFHDEAEASLSFMDGEFSSKVDHLKEKLHHLGAETKGFMKGLEDDLQVRLEVIKEQFKNQTPAEVPQIQGFEDKLFEIRTIFENRIESMDRKIKRAASIYSKAIRSREEKIRQTSQASAAALTERAGRVEEELRRMQESTFASFSFLEGEWQAKWEPIQSKMKEMETQIALTASSEVYVRQLAQVKFKIKEIEESDQKKLESFRTEMAEKLAHFVAESQKLNQAVKQALTPQEFSFFEESLESRFLEVERNLATYQAELDRIKTWMEADAKEKSAPVISRLETIEDLQKKSQPEIAADLEERLNHALHELENQTRKNLQEQVIQWNREMGAVRTQSHQAAASVRHYADLQNLEMQQHLERLRRRTYETTSRLERNLVNETKRMTDRAHTLQEDLKKFSVVIQEIQQRSQSKGQGLDSRLTELELRIHETIPSLEQRFKIEILDFYQHVRGLDRQARETFEAFGKSYQEKVQELEKRMNEWNFNPDQLLKTLEGELKQQIGDLEAKGQEWLAGFEGRFDTWTVNFNSRFDEIKDSTQNTYLAFESEIRYQIGLVKQESAQYAKSVENVIREAEMIADRRAQILSQALDEKIAFVRQEMLHLINTADHRMDVQSGEVAARLSGFSDELGKMDKKIEQNYYLTAHLNRQINDLNKQQQVLSNELGIIGARVQDYAKETFKTLETRLENQMSSHVGTLSHARTELDREFKTLVRDLEKEWNQRVFSQEIKWQNVEQGFHQDLQQVGQEVERSVSKRVTISLLAAAVIAGVALGGLGIYAIQKAVEEKFSDASVKETLMDVARQEVPQVIREQSGPFVRLIEDQAKGEMASLQTFMEEERNKYQSAHEAALEKISFFEKRNQLSRWADEAMIKGARDAYDELVRHYETGENEDLKLAAFSELARVKSYLRTQKVLEGYPTLPFPAGEWKDRDILDALIQSLMSDEDWRSRARAAQLLAAWKDPAVAGVLLDSAKSDNNLYVVLYALQSFRNITGFTHPDVLALDEAVRWWGLHRAEVIRKLA